jgi:hypothetical protein
MTSTSRGFTANRLLAMQKVMMKERLMYKNLQFGNSANAGHNVKTLNVALSRMSAIGAVSLLQWSQNDLAIWRIRMGIFYFYL